MTNNNNNNRELTSEIKKALNDRYALPEWCFTTEVPNATGARHIRAIDGFAFNLFPSKNYQKIAFEIKTIRSDLVKELKDGSKSNEIAKYCDNFYLVMPKELSIDGLEIPESWGILRYYNNKLRQEKKAEKINYKVSLDDDFVAGILQSLIRKHSNEFLDVEKKIHDDVFKTFDKTVENIVQQYKINLDNENYSKIQFQKFMDFCKDNNMFRCLSFETLLDYLLQGIYLSKMEKEILFTADKLSSIKNKFIEKHNEINKEKEKILLTKGED